MAKWQRTIDVSDTWGTKDVQLISESIAEQLKSMAPFDETEVEWFRNEFVKGFTELAENSIADVEEFDCLLEELYDWGDTPLDELWDGKKVCWIRTF